VTTAVVCDRGREGFIQARWRRGIPAQDLLFIAPSLDKKSGAAWAWQRLIHELVQEGIAQGVQRYFAHLPEDRHGDIEVMRQSGFSIFGQDRIFRLDRFPTAPDKGPSRWKAREPVDDWGLTRLYIALTPTLVQQSENPLINGDGGYVGWWGGPRFGGFVLRGAHEGEVLGYLRLIRGEQAHWMKMVLHPDKVQDGDALVHEALALMRGWKPLPIFTDVRDYEGFVIDELERAGFRRVMNRTLLVRHTTAAIRAVHARPALEAVGEVAPTPF
jgi:hypothetical protein